MLQSFITNPNEFEKSEFIQKAEVEGYKVYSGELIKSFTAAYKKLLQKSEFEPLTTEEETQLKIFKSELESIHQVKVLTGDNNGIKSEVMYYRTAADIEKAAGHKYYKREGTPGNYKYYYTEEQYRKAKGKLVGGNKKEEGKVDKVISSQSIKDQLLDAPIGAKASGGGYAPWKKIGRNSWENTKTDRISTSDGLFSRIGTFSDFKIENK